jgi:hypothetical protein
MLQNIIFSACSLRDLDKEVDSDFENNPAVLTFFASRPKQ